MRLVDVIEQYLVDGENRGRAPGTLVLYHRQLGLMVRWLDEISIEELEAVTLALLRQFLNFLIRSEMSERYPNHPDAATGGRLAPTTVGNCVSVLKAFFQWCVEEELITSNPAARLKKPKVPQKVIATFTPEHIDRLLAVCDTETRAGYRDYVMILLLLDTGMRVSELCALRLSDVHPKYVKVSGKGMKEREIGLHPQMSKLLWKYIHKYRGLFPIQDDHVFLGSKGPLTPDGVETIFDYIEKRSGITDVRVSPHTFRHTFAKRYLKNGGDLFKLSRELGHSGVQITGNVYLGDFKSSDAREDHDRFSPLGEMKINGIKEGNKLKKRR